MAPFEILLNFGNYSNVEQYLILKISFRNCVSSLLSTHYTTFIFTGPFDLAAQKTIGTPKFYCVNVCDQNKFAL